MRLSTPALLVLDALLLSSSSLAATDRAQCLRTRSYELAQLAACGDKGSINWCLSQLPPHVHLCSNAAVEKCFINAGCTEQESQIEAVWTLRRCDENADAADLGDLRRRQRPATDDDDASPPTTTAKGKTTAKGPTAVPTPVPAPAPTAQPETEVVTVSAASTFVSSSSSSSLTCYTTTTVSTTTCPIQSTGPRSGKETLPCFPTQVSYPTCAAGLMCRSDSQGNPVCMKLDNTFTTAGIVVSLFFAVTITGTIGAICFFCCRERREQKRLTKAAEAAAIAKQAALDKKRPSVNVRSVSGQSDNAPLMPQGGQGQVMYSTGDPFADQHGTR